MLHEKTIITSDLEADPRKKTEDMFTRNVLGVSNKYRKMPPRDLSNNERKMTQNCCDRDRPQRLDMHTNFKMAQFKS